ncbi:class II glutamine amidotransferase domain-containing protein [Kineosporia babensis]|uniref:Uncharacterized protein n=1 Tax=Kineosporia babensis TaxID=499548 RepID=A0A9X1NP05_9ACTN|nr:hypothetical protein [Kineosporia babensis]MCD5316984.1 hypothetical protein [Kineosporia babensis]
MSLLTYLPAGAVLDEGAIRRGSYTNPDGHGFAVAAAEGIIIRRALAYQSLLRDLEVLRRELPRAPALFHSLRATQGWGIVDNCHPFAIDHHHDTVIAQDGPLPRQVHQRRTDLRSKARIAAEEFIPAFEPLSWRRNRVDLERWLPRDCTAVILTHDAFGGLGYLIHEDVGTWHEGVWYSSNDFQPYTDDAAAT